MKTCAKCGKSFSDDSSFCNNCGAPLAENGQFTGGAMPGQGQPMQNNTPVNAYYPIENKGGYKGDFASAPVGLNVISVVGFVLAFLCVGFVWVSALSIIVFPVAVISLVLCTIVKAMKYDNIFANIGFIVALIITIISGVIFGVNLFENFY